MIENTDFLGAINTNPYNFQHFGLSTFVMYVNCKQISSEGLNIDTGHEKHLLWHTILFLKALAFTIRTRGLQITHDMYIKGYFMLLFDLTPDLAASEGHTSPVEAGNIRIELSFKEALKEAITCLLYLEYDKIARVDSSRTVATLLRLTQFGHRVP